MDAIGNVNPVGTVRCPIGPVGGKIGSVCGAIDEFYAVYTVCDTRRRLFQKNGSVASAED